MSSYCCCGAAVYLDQLLQIWTLDSGQLQTDVRRSRAQFSLRRLKNFGYCRKLEPR